jgi:uracil phosphoribosyltransferase
MSQLPPGVTVVEHPLVRVKLTRLRDAQTKPEEFRARLSELATLLVVEATRDLETKFQRIHTPLAVHEGSVLTRPIIVAPILRAGLGMVEGMLHVLSDVSIGHIGMKRDEETRRPESYYFNLPSHLPQADVFMVDPMLATGHSATAAISKLKEAGAKHLRFICCVACPEGLIQVTEAHPDVPIYTAAVDAGLNDRAYIVPGLGDAGDRYFGTYPHI